MIGKNASKRHRFVSAGRQPADAVCAVAWRKRLIGDASHPPGGPRSPREPAPHRGVHDATRWRDRPSVERWWQGLVRNQPGNEVGGAYGCLPTIEPRPNVDEPGVVRSWAPPPPRRRV